MRFSKFIQNLKEKIFGTEPEKEINLSVEPVTIEEETDQKTPYSVSEFAPPRIKREPYFVQIGFDFGTSYSKCVCRDVIANKAWIHIPSISEGYELPFLIPSALVFKNEKICAVETPACQYPESGLYHLKQALVKVAQKQWDDTVLAPYKMAIGFSEFEKLRDFVECCGVFYLARALGEVRLDIRNRLSNFGLLPKDYMAVNIALPVSNTEQPEVSQLYKKILIESWCLADELAAFNSVHINDLKLLREKRCMNKDKYTEEACFIYPEVSANVQGFVRSRVSSPGMYLFSDTGASTVDQSVFIFGRQNNTDHLVYLIGRVLPLGSSNIERYAAESCGKIDNEILESWRAKKERGEKAPELSKAQEWIATKLSRGTEATLAFAKQKLYIADQLSEIRLIFGGGGHSDYPYKTAVVAPFSGQLFRKAINPDVVGLPLPRDLELNEHESRWMKRLSVAYGLSFEKNELVSFTYPRDVSIPTPEEIWRPKKIILDAPTKDEC